jgi:hypothetical protein
MLVDHVVGVDPDRDWITLAVIDARSAGVVAEGRFSASGDGYDEAVTFVDGHSGDTERAWVIEGSAGYGRGLAVALERRGESVIAGVRHDLIGDEASLEELNAIAEPGTTARVLSEADNGVSERARGRLVAGERRDALAVTSLVRRRAGIRYTGC